MLYGLQTDVREAIDELTSGTNHRYSFIDPATLEIGVGHAGKSTVVLFQASKDTVVDNGGVYPFEGQQNVRVAFDILENPNPLEEFGKTRSGFPISYMFPAGIKPNRDTQKFSLKDSKGADVPTYNSYSWYGEGADFYPKSNLKYGERYTATFEYTNKDTGQKSTKNMDIHNKNTKLENNRTN